MRTSKSLNLIATAALGLALSALLGCSGGGSSGGSASTVASSTSGTTATPTSSASAPANSASAAPIGTDGRLRMLSYNVAGLPQFVSKVHPLQNSPLISPKLNRYDLVLLQEDFYYHAAISWATTHPYESQPLTQYTSLVNDGLNRFSSTPFLLHTRTTWQDKHGVLSNSSDALSSKGFSVAIHELTPGVEVHVWNHHADAGSSPDDITTRARNYDQLANAILSFSAGQAVILAGDTNLSVNRPQDMAILNDFLGKVGLRDVARTLGQPETIDRVMWRDSARLTFTPVLWREADEFVDANGDALSDHPALNIEFDWQYR